MNLQDARGKTLQLGESIGHGGEATVYRVVGQPGTLAKIYEPEPRPNYAFKLGWMVDHPPENPTQHLGHSSLAWPSGLLFDTKKRLKGYQMPFIDHTVPLLEVFNPRRRALLLPAFNRRYLLRTAHNLAAAVSALHHSGYVAGDINESNVLVTPTALVTLIDTDSFQVKELRSGSEIIYHCPVGKPEYTPPELQGKPLSQVTRLPDHDAFGLAVLVFQLLMEGSHPFRAQWLGAGDPPPIEARIAQGAFPYVEKPLALVAPPKNAPDFNSLHPWLAELFRRCFVEGHRAPRWRPGPDLWAKALAEAEQSLVLCAEGHYYSGHLSSCPYCAIPKRVAAPQKQPAAGRPQTRNNRAAAARPRYATPASAPAPRPASANIGAAQAAAPGAGGATVFTRPPFTWSGRTTAAAPAVKKPTAASASPVNPTGVLRGRPLFSRRGMKLWVRERIRKSFLVGGMQGALAGAIPGAVIALMNWSSGHPLDWSTLLAFGGASAGLLRGWPPGHRLASLIDRYVGWKRFWEAFGLCLGALGGFVFGLPFILLVVPLVLMVVLGAQTGRYIGSKLWQLGQLAGWDKIWAGLSALGAAALGWGVANLAAAAGLNHLGAQLAVGLMPFSGNEALSWAFIWALAGGTGGALAGAVAGIMSDLFGRLSGLVD